MSSSHPRVAAAGSSSSSPSGRRMAPLHITSLKIQAPTGPPMSDADGHRQVRVAEEEPLLALAARARRCTRRSAAEVKSSPKAMSATVRTMKSEPSGMPDAGERPRSARQVERDEVHDHRERDDRPCRRRSSGSASSCRRACVTSSWKQTIDERVGRGVELHRRVRSRASSSCRAAARCRPGCRGSRSRVETTRKSAKRPLPSTSEHAEQDAADATARGLLGVRRGRGRGRGRAAARRRTRSRRAAIADREDVASGSSPCARSRRRRGRRRADVDHHVEDGEGERRPPSRASSARCR